jgi:hypothetical protein
MACYETTFFFFYFCDRFARNLYTRRTNHCTRRIPGIGGWVVRIYEVSGAVAVALAAAAAGFAVR